MHLERSKGELQAVVPEEQGASRVAALQEVTAAEQEVAMRALQGQDPHCHPTPQLTGQPLEPAATCAASSRCDCRGPRRAAAGACGPGGWSPPAEGGEWWVGPTPGPAPNPPPPHPAPCLLDRLQHHRGRGHRERTPGGGGRRARGGQRQEGEVEAVSSGDNASVLERAWEQTGKGTCGGTCGQGAGLGAFSRSGGREGQRGMGRSTHPCAASARR